MNLERCQSCTSTSYCPIPTDGPIDAEVLCVGERPGQQEEFRIRKALSNGYYERSKQWCFVGDAGDEFNLTYLSLAGLRRECIRVGNTVLCGADGNKHPTDKQARDCAAAHLARDIAEMPRLALIVLMGGVACKLIDGNGGDFDLETEHGIPRWVVDWYGYTGWLVGVYHPAAGLHSTSMMIPLLSDWEVLGRWLRGGMYCAEAWQWPRDQYPEHDFRLGRTKYEVADYFSICSPWPVARLIGADSERHGSDQFSLQISVRPGTGLMVLEDDKDAIEMLARILTEYITRHGLVMTMHNAEADLEPFLRHLRKFGIREFPYRDTMQEIYHIGSFLRQGLKIAALRVLGRRRRSWEEVVGGASRRALMEWLWEGLTVSEGWREERQRISEKTGKILKPEIIKHVAEGELKHLLTHTAKSVEYESWDKIKEFAWREQEWFVRLEREVGRAVPIKGIANCTLEEAVEYGCQDASDHLELALALERMRAKVEAGWDVQEEDCDDICASVGVR